MLAILDYQAGNDQPVAVRTGVGSINRVFNLPIELSGVTMTINGAACGLKRVGRRQIEFVVPIGLASTVTGTTYPLVINNNGIVMKNTVTIVPARPDIFAKDGFMGPGGRAKLFNVTNTVFTTEPFAVRTILRHGNRLVPSVLRIYVTGVANVPVALLSVRFRDLLNREVNISAKTAPTMIEPGVYTFDFELTPALQGVGDQPIVVNVLIGTATFSSRLEDTAPRVAIL